MNKIFVVSDTHFGHCQNFIYIPRGFQSIQEHDEAIIAAWNEVVDKDDIVYHLGDVILGDNDHGIECLRRLNGKIKIIPGNHDTPSRQSLYRNCENVEVYPIAYLMRYKKYVFYLSHYPTLTSNLDSDKSLRARVINLCGHSHTTDKFQDIDIGTIYHVELDAHHNTPVLLDDIIEELKNKIREGEN